jgi:hypothetical protein
MINGAMITIAGGGGGLSLGSGVSGIISINSQTGPIIDIASADGSIDISGVANVINISCSGFVSGVQTYILDQIGAGGIQTINAEIGPNITFIGNDSISVSVPDTDVVQIYASGLMSSGEMRLTAQQNVFSSGQGFYYNVGGGRFQIGAISGIDGSYDDTVTPRIIDLYASESISLRTGQHIFLRSESEIRLGDNTDLNTPNFIRGYAEQGIYWSPDSVFEVGSTNYTFGDGTPGHIRLYSRAGIWNYPKSDFQVGYEHFGEGTPDNQQFFADDRIIQMVKGSYGLHGIHQGSGNIALYTQGLRPHINGSGIATLDDLGIESINDETGPAITLSGVDGSIDISANANVIDLSCSGYAVPREDCDWNGFPNRNDSAISYNHVTNEFSIQPVGSTFDYYINCIKYTSAGDTIVTSGTEGVYYIYYDGDVLTSGVNPSAGDISTIIRTKALVSAVYWSESQNSGIYIGEERHGMSMSPVSHTYHHFLDGLRYISGLGLNDITADGNGDLDTSAVFGVDAGQVTDEDIFHAISAVSSGVGLPVYYMTGATPNWNKTDPSGFSVRTLDTTDNTRLVYNQFTGGEWQLTEVTNNNFVLYHAFATTEKDSPTISIMGQDVYNNIASAREGALVEVLSLITNDILLPETRPIATIIFQTSDSYGN